MKIEKVSSSLFFSPHLFIRPTTSVMADFIMTLDSDDDVPSQPLARPQQQPKKSKKPSKDSLKKLSKKKQQKKLKRVMDTELSDSGSSAEEGEDESALVGGGDGGVGKMDKGFVFDGLGGGFVGDRRNNVWVRLLISL